MVTLTIKDLPRPGPDALDQGRLAWHAARRAVQAALDQPLVDGHAAIDVGGNRLRHTEIYDGR